MKAYKPKGKHFVATDLPSHMPAIGQCFAGKRGLIKRRLQVHSDGDEPLFRNWWVCPEFDKLPVWAMPSNEIAPASELPLVFVECALFERDMKLPPVNENFIP